MEILEQAMEFAAVDVLRNFCSENEIPPVLFVFDKNLRNVRTFFIANMIDMDSKDTTMKDIPLDYMADALRGILKKENPFGYIVAVGGIRQMEMINPGGKSSIMSIQGIYMVGRTKKEPLRHHFYRYMPVVGTGGYVLAKPQVITDNEDEIGWEFRNLFLPGKRKTLLTQMHQTDPSFN